METPNALRKYLDSTKTTPSAFARVVGANRSQIWRIAAGERGPSIPLAMAIEAATAGAVPVATWSENRRHSKAAPAKSSRQRAATRRARKVA